MLACRQLLLHVFLIRKIPNPVAKILRNFSRNRNFNDNLNLQLKHLYLQLQLLFSDISTYSQIPIYNIQIYCFVCLNPRTTNQSQSLLLQRASAAGTPKPPPPPLSSLVLKGKVLWPASYHRRYLERSDEFTDCLWVQIPNPSIGWLASSAF